MIIHSWLDSQTPLLSTTYVQAIKSNVHRVCRECRATELLVMYISWHWGLHFEWSSLWSITLLYSLSFVSENKVFHVPYQFQLDSIQWNPVKYLSKFSRENVNIPVESSGMEFLIEYQLNFISLQEESIPVDSSGFYLNPEESSVIQSNFSILYIVWYRV